MRIAAAILLCLGLAGGDRPSGRGPGQPASPDADPGRAVLALAAHRDRRRHRAADHDHVPAGRERLSRGADRQARQDRRLGRCGLAGGVAVGDQGHAARQQPDPVAGHARGKHDDGDHDVVRGRPEGLSVSAAGEAGWRRRRGRAGCRAEPDLQRGCGIRSGIAGPEGCEGPGMGGQAEGEGRRRRRRPRSACGPTPSTGRMAHAITWPREGGRTRSSPAARWITGNGP